jgi:hypothetical protein
MGLASYRAHAVIACGGNVGNVPAAITAGLAQLQALQSKVCWRINMHDQHAAHLCASGLQQKGKSPAVYVS